MKITWEPVIDVFEPGSGDVEKEVVLGHVHLPLQATEALPRIGECVGFQGNEILDALKLRSDPAALPVVTAVHHLIDGDGGSIRVSIKMRSLFNAEQLADEAAKHAIFWSPKRD